MGKDNACRLFKFTLWKNYHSASGDYTPHVSKGERFPIDVIKFSNANNNEKVHPTQKPVDLLEYLIKTYTNEGMTVLDNCMGSGSTGVAAKRLNRDFIGMELDQNYFEIAKRRIQNTECIRKNKFLNHLC